jgi:four helix bundle protein
MFIENTLAPFPPFGINRSTSIGPLELLSHEYRKATGILFQGPHEHGAPEHRDDARMLLKLKRRAWKRTDVNLGGQKGSTMQRGVQCIISANGRAYSAAPLDTGSRQEKMRDMERQGGGISFDFEKLDVYQLALEFADFVFRVCRGMHAAYTNSLVDQMQRSVTAVANTIAEGSGKVSRREKIKYFAHALDCAKECVPPLTIARRQEQISEEEYQKGRQYCDSICRMLVKFIQAVEAQELSKPAEHHHI